MKSWPTKLAQCAPSLSAVMETGMSHREAEQFLERFHVKPFQSPREFPDLDPILELFGKWDLSSIKIGQLVFHQTPVFRNTGDIDIGSVEADSLLVKEGSGKVVVEQLGRSHVLWEVSGNTRRLFDALIPAAKFLGERGIGVIDFDDFEAAVSTAEECKKLAGGDAYRAFFMMLLGAEE